MATTQQTNTTWDGALEALREQGVDAVLTMTGGNCWALVVHLPDGGHLLLTDGEPLCERRPTRGSLLEGEADPNFDCWYVGRYDAEAQMVGDEPTPLDGLYTFRPSDDFEMAKRVGAIYREAVSCLEVSVTLPASAVDALLAQRGWTREESGRWAAPDSKLYWHRDEALHVALVAEADAPSLEYMVCLDGGPVADNVTEARMRALERAEALAMENMDYIATVVVGPLDGFGDGRGDPA